ncbi:MAG: prolyl oligopeptidase family serine peptidase [Acidimicrobiales bacterium]
MTFWQSPITTDVLISGAVSINEVVADGTDVWWAEGRPNEGGRAALMRWRNGEVIEITAANVNVRTRVHEYGGGAWWVADGRAFYCDDSRGGELFLLDVETGEERQLTNDGHRYADGRLSADGEWFACVREVHDPADPHAVDNDLVAVRCDGSGETRIAGGHDFFASPRLGPDNAITFIAWDHPNMPWDRTILHVGSFDGQVASGGEVPTGNEAIVLPDFTADGRLLAITDLHEWWNLVEIDPKTGVQTALASGEFEIATPGWVFGLNRWVETDGGIVFVAGTPAGDEIHFPSGTVERRHSSVSSIRALSDGRVAYAASSWSEESAVWIHDGTTATRISTPRELGLGDGFFPEPEHVTFDVTSTDPAAAPGTVAHALFYEPASPESGDSGSRPEVSSETGPPLLVLVHGGPTSAARRQLSLAIRFWTSRGVAVADVDYRGSTLYGRTYRQSLWDGWGHVDVVDCVAAARHLADAGRVDPSRMVIAGGSAGGLTVLNALAHHDVFTGGISRYGVTDLAALATDTHKFEARYLDRLVGPWPDAEAIYAERSPVHHAESIDVPMLVLQGADDQVVPPSQSEAIVSALEARGVPVTYHLFAEEAHGFRRSETIVAALDAELAFIDSLA